MFAIVRYCFMDTSGTRAISGDGRSVHRAVAVDLCSGRTPGALGSSWSPRQNRLRNIDLLNFRATSTPDFLGRRLFRPRRTESCNGSWRCFEVISARKTLAFDRKSLTASQYDVHYRKKFREPPGTGPTGGEHFFVGEYAFRRYTCPDPLRWPHAGEQTG